jgi:uncharacterized protein (TIGR02246 family)
MHNFARLAVAAALLVPAAALAGEADVSAADRQVILDIAKQHDAALNRNDAAAAAALFTDDAVVVPPGPAFAGHDAIQKDMEKGIKSGYADHASTVDQIHVSGDLAWTTGGWSMTVPGPDGTRRALHGNYSTIDQREGGAWKVRALTYNLILPPPPAQSASK